MEGLMCANFLLDKVWAVIEALHSGGGIPQGSVPEAEIVHIKMVWGQKTGNTNFTMLWF